MRNTLCPQCKHILHLVNGGYCSHHKQYVEYKTDNCNDYEEREEQQQKDPFCY